MATNTRKLAALLGSSGANIADAGTINTAGITADAIDNTKIADNAVNADSIAANAVGTSEVADNVLTATDLAANSVGESELSVDYTAQSVPHIIPGVLQPAVAGKLLNGANHSGAYGTPQNQSGGDGHSYYYTDIKGSKPIKDPRIGAHFGSQRHRTSSLQLLEQETATHGTNVYSVDGRDWIRVTSDDWVLGNGNFGNSIYVQGDGTLFMEIVGYFSDVNTHEYTHPNRNRSLYVDGTIVGSVNGFSGTASSVVTPLTSRYVNAGSLANYGLNQTLGIHTLKIVPQNTHFLGSLYNIELIAQDTTSTANRSKIQIPSQNVVSFGKKFPVSGTPHYDPFTTMSYGGSGTTLSALQSLIDTDTSLGMDAWKAGTSNYHRPWNGGRVIKWVDSSGTIKTSVNMMPPNAQNIKTTASNAVSDAHVIAGTNDDTINFNTSAIDNTQAEVAKTFHVREFGNGSANGNASYADASRVTSAANQDVAFVMDDGLTGFSADNIYCPSSLAGTSSISPYNPNDNWHVTFIGTGVTSRLPNGNTYTIAQNLPFGTHIIKAIRGVDSPSTVLPDYYIDGIELDQVTENFAQLREITFHQPKKPPIPEDACVLADYMLMADFVPTTSVDFKISKGVRYCNASRDVFYDSPAALTYNAGYPSLGYQWVSFYNNNANNEAKITAFGSAYESHYVRGTNRVSNTQARLDGSNYSYVEADVYDTGGEWDDTNDDGTLTKVGSEAFHMYGIKNQTLGVHTFGDKNSSGSDYNAWSAFAVATPIHTSSHYQTFETPFLHELVGGDRNMEQTNLVCSPDGKTWDQITRDTSYIGNIRFTIGKAATVQSITTPLILDQFRGRKTTEQFEDYMTKDFAIAYDRFICLVDGQYEIRYWTYVNTNTGAGFHRVLINGQIRVDNYTASLDTNSVGCHRWVHLKRGDYIQIGGTFLSTMSSFQIVRA